MPSSHVENELASMSNSLSSRDGIPGGSRSVIITVKKPSTPANPLRVPSSREAFTVSPQEYSLPSPGRVDSNTVAFDRSDFVVIVTFARRPPPRADTTDLVDLLVRINDVLTVVLQNSSHFPVHFEEELFAHLRVVGAVLCDLRGPGDDVLKNVGPSLQKCSRKTVSKVPTFVKQAIKELDDSPTVDILSLPSHFRALNEVFMEVVFPGLPVVLVVTTVALIISCFVYGAYGTTGPMFVALGFFGLALFAATRMRLAEYWVSVAVGASLLCVASTVHSGVYERTDSFPLHLLSAPFAVFGAVRSFVDPWTESHLHKPASIGAIIIVFISVLVHTFVRGSAHDATYIVAEFLGFALIGCFGLLDGLRYVASLWREKFLINTIADDLYCYGSGQHSNASPRLMSVSHALSSASNDQNGPEEPEQQQPSSPAMMKTNRSVSTEESMASASSSNRNDFELDAVRRRRAVSLHVSEGSHGLQGSIELAGRDICPEGEMLVNTSSGELWRAPLREVHTTTILIGVDGDMRIELWNTKAEESTGFSFDDVCGNSLLSLVESRLAQQEVNDVHMQTLADRHHTEITLQLTTRRADLRSHAFTMRPYPAKTPNGQTVGVIFAGEYSSAESIRSAIDELIDLRSALKKPNPVGDAMLRVHRVSALLEGTLPHSVEEMSVQQVLGRLVATQFVSKLIDIDVDAQLPAYVPLDQDRFTLVMADILMQMSSTDDPITLTASMRSLGAEDDDDCVLIVEATCSTSKKLWTPSATAAHVIRRMRAMLSAEEGKASVTFLSVLQTESRKLSVSTKDSVRCSFAVLDSEAVSSTVIRNALWSRKHLLFFIEGLDKLSTSLDGIDVLIARLPKGPDFAQIMAQISADRPQLITVMIRDNEPGGPPTPQSSSGNRAGFSIKDPIFAEDINKVISSCVDIIAARKSNEAKISEVRALLSTSKTCPWVRGKLLGRGTSATVYEATNTLTEGKMAVRVVRINRADPEEVREVMTNLIEEIKLMSSLEHKNTGLEVHVVGQPALGGYGVAHIMWVGSKLCA